jgi:hypothetical protein
LPQLPGKTQPRAIIVCGRRPPSRRAQQQTPSRDPRTRRPLRRQHRPRRRRCVHAGLIPVTRRAPRLNKWRRHPPPRARQPSSLAFLTSQPATIRFPLPTECARMQGSLGRPSLLPLWRSMSRQNSGAKRRNQEPA